jgi:predicted DNA-binding transcriptional regulator YafY
MRGDQLARQWRILRTIESKKQGTTVAELASQEDCHPRTIWRDLAAIQEAGFPLYTAIPQKASTKRLQHMP